MDLTVNLKSLIASYAHGNQIYLHKRHCRSETPLGRGGYIHTTKNATNAIYKILHTLQVNAERLNTSLQKRLVADQTLFQTKW